MAEGRRCLDALNILIRALCFLWPNKIAAANDKINGQDEGPDFECSH